MVCGRITLMFISTIVAASGSRALRYVSVHIEKEDLIATDGETNSSFRSSKTHIFEKIADIEMNFLLAIISSVVVASGSRALRCISVHIEKENLIATDEETNSCFRNSETHIFKKITEIDRYLHKKSPSFDVHDIATNITCLRQTNSTSAESCSCRSLLTILLPTNADCDEHCTIISVFVPSVTRCSCNTCHRNQLMMHFGKPEEIGEGTGSISTIILGGTIVAGGVVLGFVIGAGATMYIFKRVRRRTVENEELQEQYITTESRDPVDGHSYTPCHVQANNTDTDNCENTRESQIYDPVISMHTA